MVRRSPDDDTDIRQQRSQFSGGVIEGLDLLQRLSSHHRFPEGDAVVRRQSQGCAVGLSVVLNGRLRLNFESPKI
ncbi:hypothetical protein OROGR_010324 [Orobanche gracilis]